MSATALEIVGECRRAATMLHPMRLRLLAQLKEPDSASGLARRMNLPRQKVNYHLRELEKEHLVEFVEERRKGNCVERIVRSRATSYLIDPHVLGGLSADPAKVKDRFSASFLVATAVQIVRDVAVLIRRARTAKKDLPTLTMQVDVRFASARDRQGFTEELANTVAKLTTKYHDESAPKGRLFRFIVGSYPVITKSAVEGDDHKREEP